MFFQRALGDSGSAPGASSGVIRCWSRVWPVAITRADINSGRLTLHGTRSNVHPLPGTEGVGVCDGAKTRISRKAASKKALAAVHQVSRWFAAKIRLHREAARV